MPSCCMKLPNRQERQRRMKYSLNDKSGVGIIVNYIKDYTVENGV